MTLWFENSQGMMYEIGDCANWTEVCDTIDNYIDKCNENKPADQRFISYYKRIWKENGMTKIDVGSWSEFFYWEGELSEGSEK